MKTKIDYYGNSDNYIHLKFGDVRKTTISIKILLKNIPNLRESLQDTLIIASQSLKLRLQLFHMLIKIRYPCISIIISQIRQQKSEEEIMAYLVNEASYIRDLTK